MTGGDQEKVWTDMRERLMRLTLKQLKQIAREEGIALGYAGSRKDSCVGEIVAQRRHRALSGKRESEHPTPWRKFRSVEKMGGHPFSEYRQPQG